MEVLSLGVSAVEAFKSFSDVGQQKLWVPGVKKVKVVRTDASGRALEVYYEFGDSLSYALVYAWDEVALKVRWVPSASVHDGVSGSAWFEAQPTGSLFHYHLEALKGRTPAHEGEVARAFAKWVSGR